jgi:M6 family metalloprotease-like protein
MSVRHLCAVVAVLSPSLAFAQDVEMMARTLGRPVPRGYYERIRRDSLAFSWPAALAIPPRSNVLTIVVIPTLFADTPAPPFTQADLQRTLFDGPAPFGTIAQAFPEYSAGKLQVRGTVVPWVRSTLTLSQVLGSDQGFGSDSRLGEFVRDAFVAADPAVNFGQFDNNGPDAVPNTADDNGVVDAAIILYPDRALPCGGTGPWPGLSAFGAWFPNEPVWRSNDARSTGGQITVSGWVVSSAAACAGTGILNSAILSHELGHTMGLPDLYDTQGSLFPQDRRWVAGCWDLMGAGAWGCGDGAAFAIANRPAHPGAWSKDQMGWLNGTDVIGPVRDREYVLRAANTGNDALRIPVGPNESYLIEYRERDSFDVDLAASGVLIWHIDESRTIRPCPTCPPIYRVMLKEADGNQALLKTAGAGGNRGEAGDVFGAVGTARFSAATNPASKLHSGHPTFLTIHSIVIDTANHTARVRLTTDPTPEIATTAIATWPVATAAERVVRVTGGVHPYEATLSSRLPDGLSLVAVADDVLVRGAPLEVGSFTTTLTVRDALGTLAIRALTLSVTAPALTISRLLEPLVDAAATPLSAPDATYLDHGGNRNGRYDLGDFRAHVLATR